MTLEKLTETHQLAETVVLFCRSHGLIDLLALELHYAYHGTFTGLVGCTDVIEDRLLDLLTVERARSEQQAQLQKERAPVSRAKVHSTAGSSPTTGSPTYPSDQRRLTDLSLEQIKNLFGLSVRAFNVCENADLTKLSEIQAFALKHGDFRTLRNCGAKTKMELWDLLDKAAEAGYSPDAAVPSSTAVDPARMEAICTAQYLKLSTQARNFLQGHIGDVTPEAILQFFTQQGRKMPKIPGAGSKVMRELRTMRERTMNALTDSAVEWPEMNETRSVLLRWSMRHQIEPDLLKHVQQPDGRLSLFRFLERYLSKEWNASPLKVYRTQLTSQRSFMTLDAIASEVGLTRERVRQLMKKMDQLVIAHLAMVSDLQGVREQYPELLCDEAGVIVDDRMVSVINEREGTTCSPLLVAYTALVLNSLRLVLVKWTDLFGGSNRAKELDRTHPLLIDHGSIEALQRITGQAIQVIEKKRSTPEQRPLSDFWTTDGTQPHRDVRFFVGKLLTLRYPEIEVEDSLICLPANTHRNQEELLEEVLIDLGEPSHATRIMETWNNRFPHRPITVEGIRSVAVRNKTLFISIGRKSTYGLRRWELERDDLKGGTIRDIIEELVQPSLVPLHLEDLVEEVRKYRPGVSIASVRQNLLLEASGRFVLLPGGFVGLSGRQYDTIPDAPITVPGSLLRANVLKRFVGQHRDTLAEFIAERCKADRKRIDRVIDGAIADGRIQLDPDGVIALGHTEGEEPDSWSDELPLEW